MLNCGIEELLKQEEMEILKKLIEGLT